MLGPRCPRPREVEGSALTNKGNEGQEPRSEDDHIFHDTATSTSVVSYLVSSYMTRGEG